MSPIINEVKNMSNRIHDVPAPRRWLSAAALTLAFIALSAAGAAAADSAAVEREVGRSDYPCHRGYGCSVIAAWPDVRTTPDAFGARKSRIWNFVREHKDELKGLEPDDLRLFALWLDLLCVDYSWSGKKSVTDANGVKWPLHPDLDVENPLGLERVPQTAGLRAAGRTSETLNTKGSTR